MGLPTVDLEREQEVGQCVVEEADRAVGKGDRVVRAVGVRQVEVLLDGLPRVQAGYGGDFPGVRGFHTQAGIIRGWPPTRSQVG